MKKKSILGIVAVLMFTTLLAVSCDLEEKNPFKGTWKTSQGYTVTFSDSTWELPYYSGGGLQGVGLRGTYTYADDTASITYTEITDDGDNWRAITYSEISGYNLTSRATISGNKLTWGISTYTRQ